MSESRKKFYVTTPIYYVNAKPHIGTTYTTIAADVLARWRRLKGDEVYFLTGTDENSQKNVEAAKAANKDIVDYTNEMAGLWRETWLKLGISFDRFIRTTSPEHKRAVYEFFKRVNEQGDVYQGDYEGYYCVGCEAFVKESDLVDGLCPIHKTKPDLIKEKNYFFRASKYRDRLLEHIEKNPDFIRPESRRNEVVNYIREHFDDFSITRQSMEWGIPLPIDESQVIYVWFDALLNYLSGIGFGQDEVKFNNFWPADVQLVGKDIIKFHCAYWPAMLLSAGLPLPRTVFAHGFFTINNEKISKSLGNTIDPVALSEEYPFDAIRYFLLREIPFGEDGDFSHERLKQRYNSDLANDLGNLVQRTLNMIKEYLGSSPLTKGGEEGGLARDIDKYLERLQFDKALERIWQEISRANKYIDEHKPWELAKAKEKDRLNKVLSEVYAIIRDVNEVLQPFMPETAERIKALLEANPIKVPQEPLFPRKA